MRGFWYTGIAGMVVVDISVRVEISQHFSNERTDLNKLTKRRHEEVYIQTDPPPSNIPKEQAVIGYF